MFSVFIGVFGPRLGNRQQVPAGTTLNELSDSLTTDHARRVAETLGSRSVFARGPAALDPEVAGKELEALVRAPVALPESGDRDATAVRWLKVDPIRAPGARGAVLFGRTERGDFVSVAILRDEDRYTVFDRYGRPVPLPLGEEFRLELDPGGDDLLVVFRERDLVFAVQSNDSAVADEVAAGFRYAEALRAVRAVESEGPVGPEPGSEPEPNPESEPNPGSGAPEDGA